jgi:hypothetical protein
MPLSPPSSLFSEPLAAPSLPFIIFSHANDLIRMTSAGFVDPKTLGALHRQHDADAVLLQFNRGPRRLHASISSNLPAQGWRSLAFQAWTAAGSVPSQPSGCDYGCGLHCTTAADGISPSRAPLGILPLMGSRMCLFQEVLPATGPCSFVSVPNQSRFSLLCA